MSKLCECGCGGRVSIAKRNDTGRGWVKGQPIRFIAGHSLKPRSGSQHPGWKGGRVALGPYVGIRCDPSHPGASSNGYIYEHRLIAEQALGKSLPETAVVHHVNGDPQDNRPENLVVCQDQAYHVLLHQRERRREKRARR